MNQLVKRSLIYTASFGLPILTGVGCATKSQSLGFGSVVGGATGAAMGAIVDPASNGQVRTRNVLVGATLGAAAGAIAGNTLFDERDKERENLLRKGQAMASQRSSGPSPELTNAKIETRWIEGRVQGNRYIDGHYEHIIVEPVRWGSGN